MIQVQVDGNNLQADLGGLNSMGDVLELVKATIDPDSIITSIEFNGESLSENDWSMPLTAHHGRLLQIRTGGKAAYVAERMQIAPEIVQKIKEGFARAGSSYRTGFSPAGNSELSTAVEDLKAFVNWFVSLLAMDVTRFEGTRNEFVTEVNALHKICEQILQQQLYNSWWALSETINTKLTPKLEEIQALCSRVSGSAGSLN